MKSLPKVLGDVRGKATVAVMCTTHSIHCTIYFQGLEVSSWYAMPNEDQVDFEDRIADEVQQILNMYNH